MGPDFTPGRLARPHPKAPDLDTTDAEIIGRVLAGDRDGFHILVRRHSGPLWSTLCGALANLEDAREVFQETWLRAFQRLDTLREPERVRAWLLSIALNLVRQELRRRGVRGDPREVPEQEADHSMADATEAASRGELVALLRTRVAELPDRQREVVDLRLNHGLSHGEIGRLLSITEAASRANFYQALRKLRSSFGSEHEDSNP